MEKNMSKTNCEIEYFQYDGLRLPRAGEWYGHFFPDECSFEIHKSSIDFCDRLQYMYKPVYRTHTLLDGKFKFEEEGW